MKCPNCKIDLVSVSEFEMKCPDCCYSITNKPVMSNSKVSSAITEANKEIKQLLVEARMTGDSVPWERPFVVIKKSNYETGRVYNGMNRWLLSYSPDLHYITQKGLEKRGLSLVEDARARTVFAWIPPHLTKRDKETLSPEEQSDRLRTKHPVMVSHTVYTSKDVVGLPEKTEVVSENKKYDTIESFLKDNDIIIKDGYNSSDYEKNVVKMPRLEQFNSSDEYYRTMFSTIIKKCNTELNKAPETDKEIVREKMVSEMGGAYLCHYFGISVGANSVSRIDEWLVEIENDGYLFMTAGQRAEKALTHLKIN